MTPKRPGPKKRPGPPKGSVGRRKAPEARHDPYRRYVGEPGYRAPSGDAWPAWACGASRGVSRAPSGAAVDPRGACGVR
jgi:hypothetical protein